MLKCLSQVAKVNFGKGINYICEFLLLSHKDKKEDKINFNEPSKNIMGR
jgi:hypothetical protein